MRSAIAVPIMPAYECTASTTSCSSSASIALRHVRDVRLQRDRRRQQVRALADAGQRDRVHAVALRGERAAPRGASTSRRARRRARERNSPSDHLPAAAARRCARRPSRAARAALRRCAAPSSGGGSSVRTGVALSLIGLATRRRSPASGCSHRVTMPRSCTCGSANTSARLLIAPHGTLAASSAAAIAAFGRVCITSSSIGTSTRAVAHAVLVAGEARVGRQLGPAGDLAELGELAVVADRQDHVVLVAVGGGRDLEHLVRHDVLVRVAGAAGHLAAHQVVGAEVGQHRHLRVQQRHVDRAGLRRCAPRGAAPPGWRRVAYMPVNRSATATPTFCGPPPRSSRSPVMLMSPPMPCTA